MQCAYESAFDGKETLVLVEEKVSIGGVEYYIGHNERYVKLAFLADSEEDLHNRILSVKVTGKVEENILLCERIKA